MTATELERSLDWQMRAVSTIPTPVSEHRFHSRRRWRFDFAWPALEIAVEIEGGSWVQGAHGRGKHFESDCEKYNEAAIAGWLVLRVTTDMVEDGRAVTFVERAIQRRRAELGNALQMYEIANVDPPKWLKEGAAT
jgi:very-short-patch-repair endonuclease